MTSRTIMEPERTVAVLDEVDVLVEAGACRMWPLRLLRGGPAPERC